MVDETIAGLKTNQAFLGQIEVSADKLSRNYFEVLEFEPNKVYTNYDL